MNYLPTQKRSRGQPHLELRAFSALPVLSDTSESRSIKGYAALYNVRSEFMGFFEEIKPGAFEEAISKSDIRCLFNHDPNFILGRTPNTLRVWADERGLGYEVDLPETMLGDTVLSAVRRGDVRQSSFAFTVGEDDWTEIEKGVWLRQIVSIDALYDVSPVTYPAYPDTTVASRNLAAILSTRERAARYSTYLDAVRRRIKI